MPLFYIGNVPIIIQVVQRIRGHKKQFCGYQIGLIQTILDWNRKDLIMKKMLPEFLHVAGGRIAFSPPEQLQKL
jgi:hypothetical protein